MVERLVLDTSVLLKWFRQGEVLASQALALRAAYLAGQALISAPSLLAYELANVLHYKSDLTLRQVEEAVQSLFDMGLEWVPPSAEMMRRAVAIARDRDVTVYDASFVALSENLEAAFVTADEQLIHRLEAWPSVRFLGVIDVE
jgi:predicted nucleic acid-binding protein